MTPRRSRTPTRFIIDRAVNRHAAFGLGIHRCVGSNLARLELRVALEEFIARYPTFEVADDDAASRGRQGQVRGPRQTPAEGARLGPRSRGSPRPRDQSSAIHASISSGSRGSAAERFRAPVGGHEHVVLDAHADAAVLLGHREVVRLEVEAGLHGQYVAFVQVAVRTPSSRAFAQSCTSMPSMWLTPCRV